MYAILITVGPHICGLFDYAHIHYQPEDTGAGQRKTLRTATSLARYVVPGPVLAAAEPSRDQTAGKPEPGHAWMAAVMVSNFNRTSFLSEHPYYSTYSGTSSPIRLFAACVPSCKPINVRHINHSRPPHLRASSLFIISQKFLAVEWSWTEENTTHRDVSGIPQQDTPFHR